jgi:uncharacterized protein YegP (UPF0339 family)
MVAKFELYRDSKGEYRWRLRARNSQIIAIASEGYSSRAACEHGIDLVRTMTEPEIFQDKQGGYRWRLVAANGNIIANSGEGYVSRSNCSRAITAVKRIAPSAELEEEPRNSN